MKLNQINPAILEAGSSIRLRYTVRMQKILLFAIVAMLLSDCSTSDLKRDELVVYADNSDNTADNEASFELSGNYEHGKEDDDTPTSARQKNQQMINAAKVLGSVLGTLLKTAGVPGVGAGISVVTSLLTELNKDKRSLWQKIEENVELKIGQQLAKYHVDRLKAEVFRVLESRIQDTENFGPADLRIILDKKHMVFPHNWPTLGWSYQLPLGIIYWMPFMIAGYQQMIKDNKKPTCALANEMEVARANIITSMKEMLRKRYNELRGTQYSSERVNYPCNKKKAVKAKKGGEKRYGRVGFSNERVCVAFDALLTWSDGLDGKRFTVRKRHRGWIGDSWRTKFNKVRDDTIDFLWKEVVEKVNKFFHPAICLETLDCNCPRKIEKSDILFSFPKECIANGAKGTCLHPCDDFGYNYEWCYIDKIPDDWSSCTKPDLNDCMPVTVPPITFPNVLPKQKASGTGN